MTDLVYRLRHPAQSWTQDGGSVLDKDESATDMADAADEIEKLHRRIIVLETIIYEDLPLDECSDGLNLMIVEDIIRARTTDTGSVT